MTPTYMRVVLGAMSVLVLACAAQSAGKPAARGEAPTRRIVIQTDSAVYTARRSDRDPDRIVFTLGLTVSNYGTRPIYIGGCPAPMPPALYKKDGDQWILAYQVVTKGCEKRPVVIEPNQSYHRAFRLGSGVPGSGSSPVFLVSRPGTYRVGFTRLGEMSDHPRDSIYPDRAVPDSLRYSNEFELREAD